MSRFNETKVDFTSGTVEVGAGLTWDQVYAVLEPSGVNVVGGRIPGVGVAGLTLGGGECFASSDSESWISCGIKGFHISQVSMDLRLTTSSDMNSSFQTGQS
jgi:hypothetical protein